MKSQSKVLFVNPVSRIATQGRDKQTFNIIDPATQEIIVVKGMNKTREFGTASEYSFPFNPRTNRIVTGLDYSIPNPIYQLSPDEVMEKYGLSLQWRSILDNVVKQAEIKKQTWYEILDDVAPDYYTSEVAGNMTIFNAGKNMKDAPKPNFLQGFKIILYDRPNRFEDDGTARTSRERLAIELIKVHDRIAKNKQEANSSKHHFYISEENEAETEKMKKQEMIDDAIYLKVELQRKLSEYKNYQVASLLPLHNGKPLIMGSMTSDGVKQSLNEYLSEGSHLMDNIVRFNKVMSLFDSKEGRERFEIMYLVQQAINTNVILVRDGFYIWNSKSGTPNMYKHGNYEKLISLLQTEAKNYNPKDETVTNWYGDLLNEVKSKKARIE
jgi:hypothetical protein